MGFVRTDRRRRRAVQGLIGPVPPDIKAKNAMCINFVIRDHVGVLTSVHISRNISVFDCLLAHPKYSGAMVTGHASGGDGAAEQSPEQIQHDSGTTLLPDTTAFTGRFSGSRNHS